MHSRKNLLTQSIKGAQDWVRKCSFVALDLEMTGIQAAPSHSLTALDSLQNRYAKIRMAANQYFPLQLGLCGVEAPLDQNGEPSDKECTLHPLMVPLFPVVTPTLPGRFGMCSSTLAFLSEHSMDFNDWVRNGIAPISAADHKLIQARTEQRALRKKTQLEERLKSVEFSAFLQMNSEEIDKAIEQVKSSQQGRVLELPFQNLKGFIVSALEYHLSVVHPELGFTLKFNSESVAERSKLIVTILSAEEAMKHKAELAQLALDTPDEELFQSELRALLQAISEAKTPLVVHNGLSDLAFLYRVFFGELPPTETQFKERVLECFPTIYDTKHMMKSYGFLAAKGRNKGGTASTKLGESFAAAQMFSESSPLVKLASHSSYDISSPEVSSRHHDAGFDSLATAYVFVKSLESLNLYSMAIRDKPQFAERSKAFRNKLAVYNSNESFDLEDRSTTPAVGLAFECVANSKYASAVQVKEWLESRFGEVAVVHFLPAANHQTRCLFKLRHSKSAATLDSELRLNGGVLLFTELAIKAQLSLRSFADHSLLQTSLLPSESILPLTPEFHSLQ